MRRGSRGSGRGSGWVAPSGGVSGRSGSSRRCASNPTQTIPRGRPVSWSGRCRYSTRYLVVREASGWLGGLRFVAEVWFKPGVAGPLPRKKSCGRVVGRGGSRRLSQPRGQHRCPTGRRCPQPAVHALLRVAAGRRGGVRASSSGTSARVASPSVAHLRRAFGGADGPHGALMKEANDAIQENVDRRGARAASRRGS